MTDRLTTVEVLEFEGQGTFPAVSPSGAARIVFNTVDNQLYASLDGGAYAVLGAARSVFVTGTDYAADFGDYRVRTIDSTSAHRFSFVVPDDFTSVTATALVVIAGSAGGGVGVDIDLSSDYGADGEQSDNHSETDTTSTYNIPATGTLFLLDLAPVLSAVAPGDRVGVLVDHQTIGGDLHYLGVLIGGV